MSAERSVFAGILAGEEEGTIIVRDDDKGLALIECMEPEAAVHWLAVPYEYGFSTEEMLRDHGERFNELMAFAVSQTRELASDYPLLDNGFTVKWHVGAFETIPHAKLHILSTE